MTRVSILSARTWAVAAAALVTLTAGCAGTQSATPAPQATPVAAAPTPAAQGPEPSAVPASPEAQPTPDAQLAAKVMPIRSLVPGTPSATPSAQNAQARRGANPPPAGSVDCSQAKCIALTFDDGPGPHTERLLTMLTSEGARATFFVQGPSLRANPGVARKVANTPGMEIGDHSASHPQLTQVGSSQLRREIVGNHATIKEITGKDVTVFRPPYGARNSSVDAMAAQAGESVILWDVDTMDWKTRSASATRQAVRTQASPGSIVLMHDIHGSTVDAVPGIIDDLKGQGYTLVTVTELLGGTTPGQVYIRR